MRRALGEKRRTIALCFLTDAVLMWLAFHVATLSRLETLYQVDYVLLQRDRLVCLGLYAAAACLFSAFSPDRLVDRFDSMYYALIAVGASSVAELVLVTLTSVEMRMISRREIILGALFGAVSLTIWRYFAPVLIRRFPSFHRRFVVIGSEREGRRIAESINKAVGLYADAHYTTFDALEQKSTHSRKTAWSRHVAPEDAIVVVSGKDRDRLPEWVEFCEEHFQRTFLYPDVYEVVLFEHRNVLAVAGIPLVQVGTQELETPYVFIKRLMDIAAAAVGILAALGPCLVVALAIKLTSRGGVFFIQERLGKGGRPFRIYKFRTMTVQVDAKDEMGRPIPAEKNDVRVTPVGRFLRKHRIDEVPQLINVLRGDMSLVGPRPLWKDYFDQVDPEERILLERRLMVRPGLTSLSHVLGAYDSAHRDRLRYDALYINALSFAMDLRIILSTIRIVLSGKGAR